MKKSSSSFQFHFLPKYHPVAFGDSLPLIFFKDRPKYLRSLEIKRPKSNLLRPIIRNTKHIKHTSSIKTTFNGECENKTISMILPYLKTTKHFEIFDLVQSIHAVKIANRNLSSLKSYSLLFQQLKVLKSLKHLRKVETVRLKAFDPKLLDSDPVEDICEGKQHFKRIRMDNVKMEITQYVETSEMIQLAGALSKLTNLHIKTEKLRLTDDIQQGKDELVKKIQRIELSEISGGYGVPFVLENIGVSNNLTHLHLGEPFAVSKALELSHDGYVTFFSKLQDLKGLKSLKLNFYLHNERSEISSKFFKQVNLPVGLEIFGFGLIGIATNERSQFNVEDFSHFFEKIEGFKELRALRFWFGFDVTDPPNEYEKQFLNTLVSFLPHNLSKLEVLSTKIMIERGSWNTYYPRFLWKLTYLDFGKILSPDKVFEWVQSHPRVRNVQLEIPMMSNFEEKKTLFDNEMQFLEHLSLSLSHPIFEMKDCFEDLLARLSEQRGLKCLTLKIENSFNYAKTVQIMEKYLSTMVRLEDLRIKLREYPYKVGIEKLSHLKPLIQKVKFVSLSVKCTYPGPPDEDVILDMRTIFADEIRKKGKVFEV